jgi:dihydrofolate synthase/folylpolyglutamate synthase
LLDRLLALEAFGIKLGLENITRLCEALGHPERSFASLHVAGTNGKGSVTAMAHAALVAAGVRAARYTSPHLTDITERFVIGNSAIDRDAFDAAAEDVLNCADRLQAAGILRVAPTFFEATTAIAFELFRRAEVEVAVIEVGLGGRFDATNVITPVAAAITTIGLDHMEHLGSTIEQIAFEKAGIIKPGITVVTGALPDEALRVVRAIAAERGARVVDAAEDVDMQVEMRDGRARVTIATPQARYEPATLALRGTHQVGNALTTVRLLEVAAGAGVRITSAAIEQGLASAEWPARLEVIEFADGRRVLLDAAHNVEGAAALASYLRQWHPDRPPLVIGVMRDKDVEGILRVLLPEVSAVIATAAPTPRALPADDLARRIAGARAIADPMVALEHALAMSGTVCVAGSIFLAGAVRDGLRRRAILP